MLVRWSCNFSRFRARLGGYEKGEWGFCGVRRVAAGGEVCGADRMGGLGLGFAGPDVWVLGFGLGLERGEVTWTVLFLRVLGGGYDDGVVRW
ncbi:hypothetical protein EJ04DRAFT_125000 [Polyplosphaeria fusca]|uniref:Uncharacterized protein n=1 Tax=Polyplosphaeria fusca TaxID=682080 RepID=A0A9P4V5H6_9PLEO|nr:hypothetical protein EJ04DRAFT_125000 [Polyplosphaeria fusca]